MSKTHINTFLGLCLFAISASTLAVDVSNPKDHAYHSFVDDQLWGLVDETVFGTGHLYKPDVPTIPTNSIIDELYLKITFDAQDSANNNIFPDISRITEVRSCGATGTPHVFSNPEQNFHYKVDGHFLILSYNYVKGSFPNGLEEADCWSFEVSGEENIDGAEVNITYHQSKPVDLGTSGLQNFYSPDGYIDDSGDFTGKGTLSLFDNSTLDNENACLPVTGQPILKTAKSKKMVVLIHGWNRKEYINSYGAGDLGVCATGQPADHGGNLEFSWNRLYRNLINNTQINNDWTIARYDWSEDAATGTVQNGWDVLGADEARDRSHVHGLRLGKIIEYFEPVKVQLIAHSAGTWMARRAADYLKHKYGNNIEIEVTMLDPYVNDGDLLIVGDLDLASAFQITGDWVDSAENYYSIDLTDVSGSTSGDYFGFHKNLRLDSGTQGGTVYEDFMDSHSGPIYWYAETVATNQLPGFQFSIPYQSRNDAPKVAAITPLTTSNIASNQIFTLEFDKSMTVSSLQSGGVSLYGEQSGTHVVQPVDSYTSLTHTYQFNTSGTFILGETVIVTVNGIVTDSLGNNGTLEEFAFVVGIDSDNDGLPDEWEMSVVGNLTALNGTGDYDQDGITDADEFAQGTDPLIDSIVTKTEYAYYYAQGSSRKVIWRSVSLTGSTYSLYSKSPSAPNLTRVATGITATSYTLTSVAAGDSIFVVVANAQGDEGPKVLSPERTTINTGTASLNILETNPVSGGLLHIYGFIKDGNDFVVDEGILTLIGTNGTFKGKINDGKVFLRVTAPTSSVGDDNVFAVRLEQHGNIENQGTLTVYLNNGVGDVRNLTTSGSTGTVSISFTDPSGYGYAEVSAEGMSGSQNLIVNKDGSASSYTFTEFEMGAIIKFIVKPYQIDSQTSQKIYGNTFTIYERVGWGGSLVKDMTLYWPDNNNNISPTKSVAIPHFVTSNLTVPDVLNMEIQAGAYIMFSGSRTIINNGNLDFNGSPTGPIYLTYNSGTPSAGDWTGIVYSAGSTGNISFTLIEYPVNGLKLYSSPIIDNLTVRHVSSHGLYLGAGSSAQVTNSIFEDAGSYGIYAVANAGPYAITNSIVRNNVNGVYITGTGQYSFTNNLVETNDNAGHWLLGGGIYSNNTYQGNGDNDVLRVQGSIAQDTVFDQDIKLIGQVVINAGVKLTIKPGVTIYGADRASRLIVKGDLQAVGTTDELITFTSDNATPAAGDWGYIHFAPGSTGSLQYVTVEYGGDDNCSSTGANSFGVSCRVGLASTSLMIESSPTLDNVLIKNSGDITAYSGTNPQAVGLWVRGEGAPTIQNSVIDDAEYYGFYANGTGNYSFSNNTIQSSSYGAYAAGSGAFSFVGNQILANGQAGSWVASALATVASNTIDGNGDNDALRVKGTITKNTLFAEDIKLVGQVTIDPGVTVTLSPGITIYGADRSSRLIVKGALIANSPDEANRILFTSDNETPAAGDWGYIHFAPGSTGSLKYVTVEYGGDDNCSSSGANSFGVSCRAGLASTSLMIESSPTLDHVLIKNSADITQYQYSNNNSQAVGLWIRGEGAPTIQNSEIDDAEYYGIYSSATKSVSLNALTIIGTKTNLGAYATNGFLNLTQTDWGTNTGPYHATENPEGLGATVSGNVIFKWWKGEDTDGDGLPDYWEYLYGSNANVATNTSSDNDGDGLTLLEEFQLGTDFNSVDTDEDGLSDAWESEHGMQATVASDASQDFDGDGLSNLEEFTLGTDINLADSDNDGFVDNLDELPLITGEHLDFDKDGVGDFADNDDDNDGIPDSFEFSHGLNSKNASDALLDMDGDGSSNLDEFLVSTDLNNASANATVHQHIIPLQTNIMVRAGNEFYSYLNYETTDANTALPGLAFRLHFSSAAIEYIQTSAIFDTNFIVDSGVQIDTDNADNDPNTDSFLSFTWQDNSASWPGVEDLRLLKLKFKLLDSVAVNSQHVVNFSVINTQISADNIAYGFNSTSMVITEGYALDLDINGDGIIDGLTDGAIFTRFMMGYSVESISTEAEMINSTRTKQEMYQLLQAINNKQTVL